MTNRFMNFLVSFIGQGLEPVKPVQTCFFQGSAPQSEDENTPQKRVEKIFDQVKPDLASIQ